MPDLLLQPVPHREASDFIRSKPAVARAVFDQLVPELQARAFAVAGIESINVLESLRDKIAELPLGANWEETKRDVAAELSPWLGDGPAAGRRAETLLRWHGFQAYSAAQYEVLARHRDVFPFLRYESSEDGKVRPAHAALNGKILPAEDPFWLNHTGPWEYGCRCRVVPLTQDDVDEVIARERDLPPEARSVITGQLRRELDAGTLVTADRLPNGNIGPPRRIDVRTPAEKGREGPSWRAGDLHISANELRKRYDPETWSIFEAWARAQILPNGSTLWDWLAAPSFSR